MKAKLEELKKLYAHYYMPGPARKEYLRILKELEQEIDRNEHTFVNIEGVLVPTVSSSLPSAASHPTQKRVRSRQHVG